MTERADRNINALRAGHDLLAARVRGFGEAHGFPACPGGRRHRDGHAPAPRHRPARARAHTPDSVALTSDTIALDDLRRVFPGF